MHAMSTCRSTMPWNFMDFKLDLEFGICQPGASLALYWHNTGTTQALHCSTTRALQPGPPSAQLHQHHHMQNNILPLLVNKCSYGADCWWNLLVCVSRAQVKKCSCKPSNLLWNLPWVREQGTEHMPMQAV
jgi:hypothetical protein